MDNIGGLILVIMMMLTIVDIALRIFGRPITGTYELVALAGAMVVGFAVPQTTQENGHIGVDLLVTALSIRARNIFFVITKIMGAVLCSCVAWFLYKKGNHLLERGDVSHTLQIPAYPGAYVLAFCFVIESLILLLQIPRLFLEGDNNE
jgi:TRAP-type C4-dicarboxylate transport system permease small subunit